MTLKNKNLPAFWIVTIALIVIKLIIHYLTATVYELHRDEMLYFAMGQNLSIGYVSTPPFVGFLAFIVNHLFGYSEFGLKLFPALAGAASLLIIALFVREMGGKAFAVAVAGIGFIASGAFLRSDGLFMPVCFDQLFWLWSSYLFLKLIKTRDQKYWIWIGIVFGFAFLNKYAIVFFAFALIVALLISEHRELLQSRYLGYGVIAGIAIIVPNLIWQHLHNWPVVHHMLELQRTQLINVSLSGFLFDQLFMCLPALFIWMTGLAWLLFSKKMKEYRFIAWAFMLVILILILGRGKSYYTLGAYPMLLAAGGFVMERYFNRKLSAAIVLITILFSVQGAPLELPVASFERLKVICDPKTSYFPQRWEDGKIHPIPQDYADMTGWKELAGIVSKAYNTLDSADRKKCTIYADNYGLASAVLFYGHQYKLPKPISFNDSYLLWAPDTISNGPFIYINHDVGDISHLFNSYPEIGRVENEYFRESGVMVLLCTNPKENFREFYREKVKKLKREYGE